MRDLVRTLSSHTTIFGTLLQILSFFESGYSENTMPKTVTYEHINLTTLRTKCDITVSCSKIKQEHWGNNFTLKSPHLVLGYLLWRRWYRFISGDAKKREVISAVWNEIPFKIRVRHNFLMLSYVLVVPKSSLVIMSPNIVAKLLFCSQTLCTESIQRYHGNQYGYQTFGGSHIVVN